MSWGVIMSEIIKKKKPKSVSLVMIVKDESHIIKECLQSMLPYIDRYDITDTGSTDGTPDLIKEFMDSHGIPGEVYMSDWKGFGDSRNNIGSRTESLNNAKGKSDYAWVIDADDMIIGEFEYPPVMDADAYIIKLGRTENFVWYRTQIFNLNSNWRYVGILHEYPECPKPVDQQKITKIIGNYRVEARTMGNRSIGMSLKEKYAKDAVEIEKALLDDPMNVRYQFYLAQSYFDSEQWEKSHEAYVGRSKMGGWPEEVFYSLYRVAMLKAMLGKSWEEIQQAFLDAYEYRPTRAEPLYQLARAYRQIHNRPKLAYIYAKIASEIPYPHDDILFVQDDVYKFGILDELGASAYYAGKPHIGYYSCKKLVEENLIPQEHKDRILNNFKQYEKIVMQLQLQTAHAEMERLQNEEMKKALDKEEAKKKKKEKTMIPKKGSSYSKKLNETRGFKVRN